MWVIFGVQFSFIMSEALCAIPDVIFIEFSGMLTLFTASRY